MALIGTKGLAILELPKRWGKNSELEGGRATINCRYVTPRISCSLQAVRISYSLQAVQAFFYCLPSNVLVLWAIGLMFGH